MKLSRDRRVSASAQPQTTEHRRKNEIEANKSHWIGLNAGKHFFSVVRLSEKEAENISVECSVRTEAQAAPALEQIALI